MAFLRRTLRTFTLALILVLVAAACSGSDSSESGSGDGSPGDSNREPVASDAGLGGGYTPGLTGESAPAVIAAVSNEGAVLSLDLEAPGAAWVERGGLSDVVDVEASNQFLIARTGSGSVHTLALASEGAQWQAWDAVQGASAVSADGPIAAAIDASGQLQTIDLQNDTSWTARPGPTGLITVAIDGTNAVVIDGGGAVHALDLATGTFASLDGLTGALQLGLDGTTVIATAPHPVEDNGAYTFDLSAGGPWVQQPVKAEAVAVSSGTLAVLKSNGALFLANAGTGNLFELGWGRRRAPGVSLDGAGGLLAVHDVDGIIQFYDLDYGDGWDQPLPNTKVRDVAVGSAL